jgi:hypothetical protein
MVVAQLAEAERELAKATASTLDLISSQTRRLAYNKTRLQEVQKELALVVEGYRKMARQIGAESGDVFDPLVKDAHEAYDEIAGHSIMSDLYHAVKQYYERIAKASRGVFDPLEEDAAQAAQVVVEQIEGAVDKAGRLRWPKGTQLAGVPIGGKYTTPENIEAYNKGLLRLNDLFPGMESGLRAMGMELVNINDITDDSTGFMQQFTDQLNVATLQYFGVRRLGYGLEQFGSQLEASGRQNIQTLTDWARAYGEFSGYATRAAAAMEMSAEMQGHLEQSVLDNIEAMRLFTPEETIEGLRVWAAGTGAVVQSQEDLQEIMSQTSDIQMLAALGNDSLAESMLYVGSGIAEFGLQLEDVSRVSALYNFVAAKTFAEISDVGNAFKLVGPLAKAHGVSIEETAATLGLLSDQNIKGTMAGRAFRQMLIQLSKPTDAHSEAMNRALGLSEELGQSWRDMVFPGGQFVGLANYIDILASATENLTAEQRNSLLATIATANELPAITALVNSQIEARKSGINVLRSWIKWSQGVVDDEVLAFARMMEETRGIQIDATTNMYSLWEEQSKLFMESEQARLNQIENRAHALQVALGSIVLEEGAPVIDNLLDLLEKLVQFAGDHPELVTGVMVAAGAELVLGSLIRVAGQMAGVVANYLILRGAFAGFGGAVGTFQVAVHEFAAAAGASRTTGVAETGGKLGLLGILAKLVGPFALLLATGQPSGEQKVYENMLEQLRDLNVTAEQWDQIFRDARWQQVPGPDPRARQLVTLDVDQRVLDVRGVLELLEAYEMLTDEQQVFLDQLREADLTVQPKVEDLPPELQKLMAGGESTWTIYPELAGFDISEEEFGALELFEEMNDEVDKLRANYHKSKEDLQRKFNDREITELKKYHDKRRDAIVKAQQKEQDAYEKHLDKLEKLRIDAQQKIAAAELKLRQQLEDLREEAATDEAEIRADIRDEEKRETEDHLKDIRRMEEDHRDRLFDLAIKRDAYGIFQEMRSYGKERRRADEDYNDRMRRLKEEGKKRIEERRRQTRQREAELRKAHKREIAQINAQLELKLKQERENYEQSRKQRDKALARTLDDYQKNYNRQRDDRQAAHDDALLDLADKFDREKRAIEREMAVQIGMLLGYYREDVANHRQYLQDKLDDMYWFLRQYQDLWNQVPSESPQPPSPGLPPQPPPDRPPNTPYSAPIGSEGIVPLPTPGILPPTPVPLNANMMTIVGDMHATITLNGDVPAGSEDDVRSIIGDVFHNAARDLEVTWR